MKSAGFLERRETYHPFDVGHLEIPRVLEHVPGVLLERRGDEGVAVVPVDLEALHPDSRLLERLDDDGKSRPRGKNAKNTVDDAEL